MKLSKDHFLKARDFILTNARVLERRMFQFHFEMGSSEGVFYAVYAYRNPDGGFGRGMDPIQHLQKACPFSASWPLKHLMKQVV